MPTIRYIADWHYNHEDIIAYDARPFRSAKEMNAELVRRWNAVVAPEDITYVLGDMLYCSGEGMREEDHAVGVFDAMRIGGDIFNWDDFLANGLDRIYDTYFYHRNAILCDADNVVIREEFNDMNQARTRATLVSLLGLPFTLGNAWIY